MSIPTGRLVIGARGGGDQRLVGDWPVIAMDHCRSSVLETLNGQ